MPIALDGRCARGRAADPRAGRRARCVITGGHAGAATRSSTCCSMAHAFHEFRARASTRRTRTAPAARSRRRWRRVSRWGVDCRRGRPRAAYVAGAIAHAPGDRPRPRTARSFLATRDVRQSRSTASSVVSDRSVRLLAGPATPVYWNVPAAGHRSGAARARARSRGRRRRPVAGADGAVVTFLGLVRNHNLGRQRPISGLRGLRAAGAEGLRAHRGRGRRALAGRAAGAAPPHRPARDRRSQRRDRRRVAASRRRVSRPAATRSSGSSRSRRSGSTSFFEGGDVWIEGATADPDDDAGARTRRERIACA